MLAHAGGVLGRSWCAEPVCGDAPRTTGDRLAELVVHRTEGLLLGRMECPRGEFFLRWVVECFITTGVGRSRNKCSFLDLVNLRSEVNIK